MAHVTAVERTDVRAAMSTLTRYEPGRAYLDPRATDSAPMERSPIGAYVSYGEVAELIAADRARVARPASEGLDDRERFTLFLYLLGRDAVPLGELQKILSDVCETVEHARTVKYSNGFLEGWARKIAPRFWSATIERYSVMTAAEQTR